MFVRMVHPVAICCGVGAVLVLLLSYEFLRREARGYTQSTFLIMLILVCLVSRGECELRERYLGHPDMKGMYPYMVFIEPVRCSGSIISYSWVLTAAHCFDSRYKGLPELYAGIVNEGDNKTAQFRTSTVVVHPMYGVNHSLPSRFYDVALLRASRPFIFNNYTKAIGLADGPLPVKEGRCRAVGFGLNERDDRGENALKWTSVVLGGRQLCLKLAHKYGYPLAMFGKHMVCATKADESGKTFCSADAGGPVVCGGVLVGVLMAVFQNNKRLNPRCGTTDAIYAYIGHHMAWIQSVVTDEELFTTQVGYEGLDRSVVFGSTSGVTPTQSSLLLVALTAIAWSIPCEV